MTHKYLYIQEDGSEVTPVTRFYIVSVSQAAGQPMRDYLYLTAHAADNNHYFAQWSKEVETFISRLEASINYPIRQRMQRVTARDLVRAFKASTSIPLSQVALSNADHMRYYLDINYRCISNQRKKSSAQAG